MDINDLSNLNPIDHQKQIFEQKQFPEIENFKEQLTSQLTSIEENENREQEISLEENTEQEQRLREEIANFTAFFVNQMFSAMRDTVPESDFIDGGFAEEVFTDMLDQEISEQGARQDSFKRLNELLFEQLSR